MSTKSGEVQGYKAQTVVNENHIVLAAEVTIDSPDGMYAFMRRVLGTELGAQLYRKRQALVEPVFADLKLNRKIDRFQRRGRSAVHSEWKLVNATHNLLKLHRHQLAVGA